MPNRFEKRQIENVQVGDRIVDPVNMDVGGRTVTIMTVRSTGPVRSVKRGWLATTVSFSDGTSKRYRKDSTVTVRPQLTEGGA